MKENFLHFLWRFRRFDHTNLFTTAGDRLDVLHPGMHNQHAGPDFLDARVRVGDTVWAGNVEIHVNASEWRQHGHSGDPAYDNVILHVVLEDDEPVLRKDGQAIPCLVMKGRIPANLLHTYQKLLHNEYWIPCQHQFFHVADMARNLWLDRLLVERLEQKTIAIKQALQNNRNDWEETFYQYTARNFGLKINALPFELLAKSVPQKILARHKDSLLQVEALVFGQAGMLEQEFEDDYPNQLKKEFSFLRNKYALDPINPAMWKYLRLHPANFPTVRLAQFAKLAFSSVHLFSKILEVENQKDVEALFGVGLDGYWLTHFVFDKESERRPKSFGKEAIRLLTINTIAPFLFLYGIENGDHGRKDKALSLLEELKPEKNSIIKGWQALGVEPASAYQTQALLQLKNEYCDKRRCLECAIGGVILK